MPLEEYIMKNTGLEEAQAGIKSARRNINNLRYVDDNTLMAGEISITSDMQMKPPLWQKMKRN